MLTEVVIAVRDGARTPPSWASFFATEFPTVKISRCRGGRFAGLSFLAEAVRNPRFDYWGFDRHLDLHAQKPFAIRVDGTSDIVWEEAARLLCRAQRCIERRNRHSSAPWFDELLRHHRSLYDSENPLVIADYDHALDVWQWMLRCDPEASAAAQIAALFHDIERLESEASERVEQFAEDYPAFKDAHARQGAMRLHELLRELDVPSSIAQGAVDLVEHHERPGDDYERKLLGDADALSFFSLNSPGFLDYFGAAHTMRKIAHCLERLSPKGRAKLAHVRMRADVMELFRQCEREAWA